ncbi:hypothetical protein OESDEN_01603 [Oesophagostomum dentatum]|uniref:Uncharacterized protein n=1 Tax=Oesophagostomum dentatum TaxID=61180 RepID=A0A0B1TLI0_OESDE|nr:hypothetical protein OESDEN_01603 [Oesophagostomum dentatum]
MKTTYVVTLAVLLNVEHAQNQIVPDCDLEFASLTTGIVQSQISDPLKLRQTQAILSSW